MSIFSRVGAKGMWRRRASVLAIVALWPRLASGYRPFDSTDASVVPAGEFELEYGPLGYLRNGQRRFFVGPGFVANLGLIPRWELVMQGRSLTSFDRFVGQPHAQIVDTGLLLKGILHEGSLQRGHGPSVATEFGPLLPIINGSSMMGATAAVIISERWRHLTVHFNGVATLTRAKNPDLLGGMILEGPFRWPVRPVLEVFIEREFGASRIYSGLAGAIWRVRENLSFDAGLRSARVDSGSALEIRAGFTSDTSLWGSP